MLLPPNAITVTFLLLLMQVGLDMPEEGELPPSAERYVHEIDDLQAGIENSTIEDQVSDFVENVSAEVLMVASMGLDAVHAIGLSPSSPSSHAPRCSPVPLAHGSPVTSSSSHSPSCLSPTCVW
jgi:hypothetical protein